MITSSLHYCQSVCNE